MKKTVLITGASSGFGKESAKLFQKNGWNVAATMRSPQDTPELDGLESVNKYQLDVTDVESIQQAVKKILADFGRIDVLVNNAGYSAVGVLEAASPEVINRQMGVNFFGMINVIQAVLPYMRMQRSGIIINLSSIGGRITLPFNTLYHASKFAVEGLTDSLQYELNPLGILLKLIEPGGYNTDFGGRSLVNFGAGGINEYEVPYERFIGKFQAFLSDKLNEVPEAIFEAATDGLEKLRYPVGQQAIQLLQAKEAQGDTEFKKMIIGAMAG